MRRHDGRRDTPSNSDVRPLPSLSNQSAQNTQFIQSECSEHPAHPIRAEKDEMSKSTLEAER